MRVSPAVNPPATGPRVALELPLPLDEPVNAVHPVDAIASLPEPAVTAVRAAARMAKFVRLARPVSLFLPKP